MSDDLHSSPAPGVSLDASRPAAYLLAGGHSRRFGSDKARALLDGEPMILRLAKQLSPMTRSVTVVAARAEAYADLGLRTIGDVHPGRGPMAGLHAALRDARVDEPWLLLCSCDMVTVRKAWLQTLLAVRASAVAGETVRAVAFRSAYWHPFPGLYHRALLAAVRQRLADEALAMQSLLDAVATPVALPTDWPTVAQANTPGELTRAAAQLRDEARRER